MSWFAIARLGLVQAALGAIVVLATATMNRVMVVELGLPAIVPGALVALHYGLQVLRPRMGHGSDRGGRLTPWIVGGMALLATGGLGAALAIALYPAQHAAALALAVVAFSLIGTGVGAAGTSLLVLMAKQVAPAQRPAAATIVWVMMIAGIAITATTAGRFLKPYSADRLVSVTAVACAAALLLTLCAVFRVERADAERGAERGADKAPPASFRAALAQIWSEPRARGFALFVFVSMLAYSAQELVLEPFAGAVFGLAPGDTARLTGLQHGGVLAGMLLVALAGGMSSSAARASFMRRSTVGGCAGSAIAVALVAACGLTGAGAALRPSLFLLGVANGAFAVSAIGAMMGLAHEGRAGRAGVRMGVWGAAQALAFGAGGLLGTGVSDLARQLVAAPSSAYALVFAAEAALFVAAALQAARIFHAGPRGAGRPADTGFATAGQG
jgi:BCD family chlorophyll transporter-like MFS transporter